MKRYIGKSNQMVAVFLDNPLLGRLLPLKRDREVLGMVNLLTMPSTALGCRKKTIDR